MELTEDKNRGIYHIKSYEAGKLVINGDVYQNSVIITADKIIAWKPNTLSDLTAEHFKDIAELKPEIVILGTGPTHCFPEQKLLADLINQQIGIEIMCTRSACTTYNILMGEDRNAIAALLIN